MTTLSGARDVRGVLHHGTLALQVVLVDGALLLLLQTALLITAPIRAAVPPDTRVAHHTWKTEHKPPDDTLLLRFWPQCAAGWPEKSGFPVTRLPPPEERV